MKVKLKLPSADQLIQKKGLDVNGHVQRFHTNNVNRRIGKYMPHLTGNLETKLKRVHGGTEIEVLGPYAQYQYFGKVMVGPPPKVVIDKGFVYTNTNPQAGPFWDRALVAAEGKALTTDLQQYMNKRK